MAESRGLGDVYKRQVSESVKAFKDILDGKYDHIPEDCFRLVGGIEDVIEKAKKLGVNA